MHEKQKYFFISDAHLGAEKNEEIKKKKLISFLNFINKKNNTIFIIGDLFDFWFEYKYVIPNKNFSILCMLNKMINNGVKIKYITGNHDFWIGDFFKNMGIEIFRDPIFISLNNKKFYIAHGDGLLKADHGYKILKKILRNPLNIKLYRLIHPDIGIALAHLFSNLSRTKKNKNYEDKYINFARNKFKNGIDYMIFGHTHIPLEFTEKEKKLINIGDWINHFTYGYFENNNLELKKWNER
ncbi:MAG: UDP-2,3-diacylglucosamine diphosphatase [bacterium]